MNEMQLIPLVFEGHEIRVQLDDQGDPWWMASDVCEILDLKNVSDAVSRLDQDERVGIASSDDAGRTQEKIFINESGLYSLTLSSRKDTAKTFKRWITKEVIPGLRKNGFYAMKPMTGGEILMAQAQAMMEVERRQQAQDRKIEVIDTKIDKLETRFTEEKINQFPDGCDILPNIASRFFPHMSPAVVSNWLKVNNHTMKPYKRTTDDNEVREIGVFAVEGITELRDLLVRTSEHIQTTDMNYIYTNPKLLKSFRLPIVSNQKPFIPATKKPGDVVKRKYSKRKNTEELN